MSRFVAAPALFRKAVILAGFVIVADQFSKWLMMVEVMQPPRVIPILPSLNLVMAWNTGVSFSMLRDSGPFLLAGLAILVSSGLFIWLMRLAEPLPAYGIGFVIGGAIGNVIDRFRYGAVFDFIDFFIGNWHWPAFNLADSAIAVGVALLFFDGLFHNRDRGKNSVPPEAD